MQEEEGLEKKKGVTNGQTIKGTGSQPNGSSLNVCRLGHLEGRHNFLPCHSRRIHSLPKGSGKKKERRWATPRKRTGKAEKTSNMEKRDFKR